MLRNLKWLLLLVPLSAFAQAPLLTNCAPSTPCTLSGPVDTRTGDLPYVWAAKPNTNFLFLAPLFALPNNTIPCNSTASANSIGVCTAGPGITIVAGQISATGGSGGTPANPTATIGASAINGTASTYMRSDAAPALSASGVTAGTYTNANITVDATGRVTVAANGSGAGSVSLTASGSNIVLSPSTITGTGTIGITATPTFTTVNGNALTAGTWTLNGAAGKTLLFNNSLTLAGTDATAFTFPAISGIVDTLNSAQTITAVKTFTNSDICLLGSSTGCTTFTSDNAGATNFTMHVPGSNSTLVTLADVQTLVSKTLTTPTITNPTITGGGAFGTPASLVLTNATLLPCAATPAFTGDMTTSAGSCAATLAATAVTAGSYTSANITVDAKGRITAAANGTASATSITPGTTTVVGATAPCLIDNSATTVMGCATLGTGFALNSGVFSPSAVINAQVGTTYTYLATDANKLVTHSNAASIAGTLPVATTSGFGAGYGFTVQNIGAGTLTITPTTSTINGSATLVVTQNHGCDVTSDGTNYQVSACNALGGGTGTVTSVVCGTGLTGGTITTTGTCALNAGTGVATAIAANLSAAGGLTSTIANGTSAMGTGAIGSGVCATVVTTTATNVATTDAINWSFNADPTAVTGYSPSANGMLTIISYPTSGNVNWKVCNNTASSITPGAITLNWRVVR